MSKLTVAQSKTIEEYWSDIPSLKKQLNFREWELLHQYKEQDTNIGGGRSYNLSDTTAQKAMLLAEDERYQNLKKNVDAIDYVIKKVSEDKKQRLLREFMEMKYISKESSYMDWDDVAIELDITKAKAYKLRNKLIDMTAEKLGWL